MKSKIFVILIMVLLVVSSGAPSTRVEAESPDPPITVYVVPPITDVKILPTTSISDSYISNDISIVASPGEYEPASFVIHADEDITSLEVEATDLTGPSGSIPSDNVDIRVVKCWYQAGIEVWDQDYTVLTPELLLKDDSLVKVEDGENYVKLTTGDYVWISERKNIAGQEHISVAELPIQDDSAILLPVDIPSLENRQFWVTVKVPDACGGGIYNGTIRLKVGEEIIGEIELDLEILPIQLLQPYLTYGLYYQGMLDSSWPTGSIGSKYKSQQQLTEEIADMATHGVFDPVCYQQDIDLLGQYMTIRNQAGMGNRPLYTVVRWAPFFEDDVNRYKSYGATEVYFFGLYDEPTPEQLPAYRAYIEEMHVAGGKVFGGLSTYFLTLAEIEAQADLLDVLVVAGPPIASLAELYHRYGHEVFCYANPQVGNEQPERYRRNYGLLLWQKDYGGAMNFAYQWAFSNIWNDFDGTARDHNFTYPTVGGVIDTIQWEGQREGVDDIRYLTTLLNVIEVAQGEGKDTSEAENYLANLKASDLTTKDLDVVRSEMIGHILYLLEEAPPAEFSATPTTGNEPLDVRFTDQSTGSIISWSWDFGDGATSTEQNPLHTYTGAGVYTVSLTVAGSPSDTETKTDYISVYEPAPFIPGDANEDGVVNSLDITKVKRIIMGLDEPTPGVDANEDGNINALDITQIELIIMGS